MGRSRPIVGMLLGAALLVLSVPVAAEDVPFVDGREWKKSAPVLKRAYLIGISNLLSAEYAYQQEFGPPPDRQTAIRRIYEGVDESTLDGVIDRVDKWYAAHPDQEDVAVLGVIWIDMVEPNLPASRQYGEEGDESGEKR